eukprot:102846-Amphidinium_carterae.1
MKTKALTAGFLSSLAVLCVYLHAVWKRIGARWSRDKGLVREHDVQGHVYDVQGYPWDNDRNYSWRARQMLQASNH